MSDLISRQAVVYALERTKMIARNNVSGAVLRTFEEVLDSLVNITNALPTIQLEITHEQAVEYLQSTGWMQEHDSQMMIDGAHRLTAQPEIIRCRNCKFASGDSRICMKFDHSPIGELDFCSFAERKEVTT